MSLQGTSPNLQGSGAASLYLQGNNQTIQGSSPRLQVTANPQNAVDPTDNGVLGASTTVGTTIDPAAAAAAAQAAADAARAASLRGQVSDLVNNIKGIFNTRYGQVNKLAQEQTNKLNTRYQNESQDITHQIDLENSKAGGAFASTGTRDSSDYGNAVDEITRAGQGQIRDLGQELSDNLAKVASWIASQKAGFKAQEKGYGAIARHLSEETDIGRLTDLRNTIESKLAELEGGSADYQTQGAQAQALASIAPSSARAVQLKTTLSQIVAGNADPSQKSAIGQSLIQNSGLSADEQKTLLTAFQSDLTSGQSPTTDQNNNVVSA